MNAKSSNGALSIVEKAGLCSADLSKKTWQLQQSVTSSRRALQELESLGEGGELAYTIAQAQAITEIRKLVKQILPTLKALRGTKLGFLTDRDRRKPNEPDYSDDLLDDVMTEALLRGLKVTGNEINILAGNLYATKEGIARVVREYPGVSDIEMEIGVPDGTGKRWCVPAIVRWKYHGRPMEIRRLQSEEFDLRLVLPQYGTDKPETVFGRAESRLYRLLYKRLTGSVINVTDDDEDVIDVDPEIAQAQREQSEQRQRYQQGAVIDTRPQSESPGDDPSTDEPSQEQPQQETRGDSTAIEHELALKIRSSFGHCWDIKHARQLREQWIQEEPLSEDEVAYVEQVYEERLKAIGKAK